MNSSVVGAQMSGARKAAVPKFARDGGEVGAPAREENAEAERGGLGGGVHT